jgi:hypothetical protein
MMRDSVLAVTEAAATGEIAELFADIRHVLGVEVVNLIWRHLAAIPRALPCAWGTLRPLYVDGTIAAEAVALHGDLDLPRLPGFLPEVLAATGLLDSDISTIRNVLAAYDRTNAMALIALSALMLRLHDEPPSHDGEASRGGGVPREPSTAIPLPPLLNIADLPPATAELVLTLNRLGTRRGDPILASMYRHLAHWPTYLALAWAMIAPLDANGSLERSIADAAAKARARAARVATQLYTPPAELAPAIRSAIRSAIEPFTGDTIARMIVICGALRVASDPAEF